MNFDLDGALGTIQEWVNGFIASLPNLVVAVLIIVGFYFLARLVRKLILSMTESRERSQSVGIVIGRLSFGLIVILGFLIALMILIPSFTPGQLLGALGVSSIAIGFAFKDILQNFLAGILILLTEPFRIGDQVVVGEFEGTVTEIETRATKMTTYDGRLVVIPNADMYTDSVTVNTAFDRRRSEYDFGIGYEDDIDKAKEILRDVIAATDGVDESRGIDLLTMEFADSSVNIRARWWTDPTIRDVLTVHDRIMSEVKRRFDAAGINIPFPIRTVYLNEASDG